MNPIRLLRRTVKYRTSLSADDGDVMQGYSSKWAGEFRWDKKAKCDCGGYSTMMPGPLMYAPGDGMGGGRGSGMGGGRGSGMGGGRGSGMGGGRGSGMGGGRGSGMGGISGMGGMNGMGGISGMGGGSGFRTGGRGSGGMVVPAQE